MATATNTPKTESASEKYGDYKATIRNQINSLNEALAQHAFCQRHDADSYAHVGDLAHVSEQLAELLQFLGAEPEDEE